MDLLKDYSAVTSAAVVSAATSSTTGSSTGAATSSTTVSSTVVSVVVLPQEARKNVEDKATTAKKDTFFIVKR